MESSGQVHLFGASPVQCHVPIPLRDCRMIPSNTTLLTSATRNGTLQSSSCSGTHRLSASQLANNTLLAFSPAPASRLKAYDLAPPASG